MSAEQYVWSAEHASKLPAIDLVSFAFGNHDEHLDKPIWVDANEPSAFITASQAYGLVRRLCKGWNQIALCDGECVTICSPNDILYPPIWLGIIGAGGVAAGANPALSVSELKHHINVTGTKYLVAHRTCSTKVAEAAIACGIPPEAVFVYDDNLLRSYGNSPNSNGTSPDQEVNGHHQDVNNLNHLSELFNHGEQQWHYQPPSASAAHAMTSGTTGLPKAAVLPHQYLISQGLMLENEYKSRNSPVSQLICLPIFHSFAAPVAHVLPLRLGITTYFQPRFHLNEFVETVHRLAITDTPVVPPIISALVQYGDKMGDKLHSLRRLICAGAPMNPDVQSKLYDYLHTDCRVSQCWGATETGWVTLTPLAELDRSGSVGRLTLNAKLKLISDTGQNIFVEGERGEALIKSTSLMLGYLNNDAASQSAFDEDGFYRTGDRAYVRKGKVFIEGRIKDVMKVKGWQVSPEELEEKIQAHPNVVDCAVMGITFKDDVGLEQTQPRAYVVLKPGYQANGEEITSWVSSQTVSYKHLTGGVHFVDSIPRNPSGKILRRVLIEGS